MKNPLVYNTLPHAIDRAHRVREIARFTLEQHSTVLLESFQTGTNTNYTFGITDESGHIRPQVAEPSQLQHDAAGRLYVQTSRLAHQIISQDTADTLGLRIAPRQLTLTLDTIAHAIVPVSADLLTQNKLQYIA